MLKDIGRVSDKYLNSLVIDGQKNVLFSPENIQLSGEMDAELQRITQKYGKIFERYGKRMIILSKSIMSDFEGMGTKQQLDRSMERVQQMLERVGIQPNGTISPSSFLLSRRRIQSVIWPISSIALSNSFCFILSCFV